MKKAVAYLVPFMEKEKEESLKKKMEEGIEITENVSTSSFPSFYHMNISTLIKQKFNFILIHFPDNQVWL